MSGTGVVRVTPAELMAASGQLCGLARRAGEAAGGVRAAALLRPPDPMANPALTAAVRPVVDAVTDLGAEVDRLVGGLVAALDRQAAALARAASVYGRVEEHVVGILRTPDRRRE